MVRLVVARRGLGLGAGDMVRMGCMNKPYLNHKHQLHDFNSSGDLPFQSTSLGEPKIMEAQRGCLCGLRAPTTLP